MGLSEDIDNLMTSQQAASQAGTTPAWPVVNKAKPVVIKYTPLKPVVRDHKVTVVLPDTQIGFRQIDGQLIPFHDVTAMDTALALIADIRPDAIVNLGDYLDLPAHSKYVQEPSFAFTTQAAIDAGYEFLAKQKASCDKIVVLSGNHESRIQKSIMLNAAASFGLKRAADTSGWPVLSPQYLLRTDELDVEWIDGYPGGKYMINNSLMCIHGEAHGNTVSALANRVWRDYPFQSVIHGHTHHNYMVHRTVSDLGRPHQQFVGSPGCLCRIDGNVPSHKSGIDASGRPVSTVMDWQQGIFVVSHTDNWFNIENVLFLDGKAFYRGKNYG